MKAILEFDLEHDQEPFTLALAGGEAVSTLRAVDQALRNQLKHGNPANDRRVMEECRSQMGEFLRGLE